MPGVITNVQSHPPALVLSLRLPADVKSASCGGGHSFCGRRHSFWYHKRTDLLPVIPGDSPAGRFVVVGIILLGEDCVGDKFFPGEGDLFLFILVVAVGF